MKLPKLDLKLRGTGTSEFFILDLSTVLVGFALSFMLFVHTFTYRVIPPEVMGVAVTLYLALFIGPNYFFRTKKEFKWIKTYLTLGFIWALFVPVSPLFLTAAINNLQLSFWFFAVYFIHVPVFLTIFRYLKTDGFFILLIYSWLIEDAWIGRQILNSPLSLPVLAFTVFAWIFQYYPIYVLTNWINKIKQSTNRTIFDIGVVSASAILTARLIQLEIEQGVIDAFLAGIQVTVLIIVLVTAFYLKEKT